jgi:hypothetical protein
VRKVTTAAAKTVMRAMLLRAEEAAKACLMVAVKMGMTAWGAAATKTGVKV